MRVARILPMVALLCACLALPVHAGETYEGIARAPDGRRLLYRETHWLAGTRHVVLYRCPDGSAFARKRIDYTAGRTSPDFELLDGRNGFRQGVRSVGGRREVFAQADSGADLRRALLASTPVIDTGFDAYLRQSWPRLAGGEAVSLDFLLPSRLKSMTFRIQPLGSENGQRRFRLALDSVLGGLLPNIDVDYDASTRRLLRYRGPSDIPDGRGGNARADIRFPPEQRRPSDGAALQAALSAPLTGRCRQ